MSMDKDKVKKILFISLSNLGDIILTTPVFQKLCAEFPGARIDVIVGKAGREIFSGHASTRNVMTPDNHRSLGERMKSLAAIRREKYDLIVDLKSTLVPFLSGARYRTGLYTMSKRRSRKFPVHKKQEHLLKLGRLGIATNGSEFFIPVTERDKEFVDEILKEKRGKKIVILNPGAKSHLKRWDVRKYAELSDKLVKELGCAVFVTGNEDDKSVIKCFLSSVVLPVADLSGRTTIGALTELMRRADLVITNDSAPLHMASAAGAPTLAIFGPSDERKYGPLSLKSRVMRPDVACRPCEKALCAVGPDEGCISRVGLDEVFRAARELLER